MLLFVHIEQEDIPLMNEVERLRQKYLDNSFYPTMVNKPRQWMQTLLVQKDVFIKHFYPNSNSNQPPAFSKPATFSKCIIRTVLSPKYLGLNTHGDSNN